MMLPLVLLLLVRPALARLENVDVLLSDATPWYYVAKFGYATGDSAWVRDPPAPPFALSLVRRSKRSSLARSGCQLRTARSAPGSPFSYLGAQPTADSTLVTCRVTATVRGDGFLE